jgi:putative ATP-dependent endonuclease of OLD family
MKIRTLELRNYRSIEDTKIDFQDYYTAICGKNNSGKSNIIRAMLNILSRAPYSERLNYNSDFPIWKEKGEKERRYKLKIKFVFR